MIKIQEYSVDARILINAALIGSIVFFSSLAVAFPPTLQNVWAGLIGGLLATLTQLRNVTDDDDDEKKPPRPLGALVW